MTSEDTSVSDSEGGKDLPSRAREALSLIARLGRLLLGILIVAGIGYWLWRHPLLQGIGPGEQGLRVNRLTGGTALLPEGRAFVVPGIHELRRFSTRTQVYRPSRSMKAGGEAPFRSAEGLGIGVEASVQYALDPSRILDAARSLPPNIGVDLIEPTVDGILHRTLAQYTVREIFSTKRLQIQKSIEGELKGLLGKQGIVVESVMLGSVDLPLQYRQGLEGLLAEELSAEKMRFTIELKEKQIRETELEAEASKVQRQKAAEAAAQEEVIAAKGKEEAMKHVLPLKEKEIEQRKLEAEAQAASRIKQAEGESAARKIEAEAEAETRKKLADADAYRIDVTGKAQSAQLARDSEIIGKNPLLIQKTIADKLSDKIQIVVAPPPVGGLFADAVLRGGPLAMPPAPGQRREMEEDP